VLELAAGTGQWTALLAESATALTAVDASPEVLRLNAAKTPGTNVDYVVSDIFELEPAADWDVVFFSAWLSHVPMVRFDAFWDLVAKLLAPGGRVFFIDEAPHDLWTEDWLDEEAGVVQRPLNDGTIHRLVKVLWRPDDLRERLNRLGWEVEIEALGPFYWGWASRPTS
jgi:2-polyprenyl-3-methyl-5-hydroxy-6-metoxy-1,4-benzoquinol methylase